jgi:hypothetical protein
LHERRGLEVRAESKIADYIAVPDSGMSGAIAGAAIAATADLRAAALRFAGRLDCFAGAALRATFFFAFFALRFAGAARRVAAARFFATLRLLLPLADFFFVFRAMIVSSREFLHCARSTCAARTFNAGRSQLLRRSARFQ